jgi:hypothetical protein
MYGYCRCTGSWLKVLAAPAPAPAWDVSCCACQPCEYGKEPPTSTGLDCARCSAHSTFECVCAWPSIFAGHKVAYSLRSLMWMLLQHMMVRLRCMAVSAINHDLQACKPCLWQLYCSVLLSTTSQQLRTAQHATLLLPIGKWLMLMQHKQRARLCWCSTRSLL